MEKRSRESLAGYQKWKLAQYLLCCQIEWEDSRTKCSPGALRRRGKCWLVKRKDGTMQCESQTAITDWL